MDIQVVQETETDWSVKLNGEWVINSPSNTVNTLLLDEDGVFADHRALFASEVTATAAAVDIHRDRFGFNANFVPSAEPLPMSLVS